MIFGWLNSLVDAVPWQVYWIVLGLSVGAGVAWLASEFRNAKPDPYELAQDIAHLEELVSSVPDWSWPAHTPEAAA